MSLAIFRVMLIGLLRDRGALIMSFVLPAIFFIIFAEISGAASGSELHLRVATADQVKDDVSKRLVEALGASPDLEVLITPGNDPERVRRLVRVGAADVGLIVRSDLSAIGGFGPAPIQIVSDPSRAMTVPMLVGEVRRAYFSALPDVALSSVVDELENQFLTLTDAQRTEVNDGLAELRDEAIAGNREVGWTFDELIDNEHVAGQGAALNHVSYFAGAVAFMFLLFASVHGAISLLEEQESGVLERVLVGPGGIGVLVNGKFLYLVLQGFVQVGVIFVVAWIGYGVDLPGHLPAWVVVTLIAALAAAGLSMLVVTACRTKRQAQAVSNVVILIMSALGGSMVPRFLMPETLQQLGWLTPNTWALEAYSGIFWRDASFVEILLPCGMLLITAAVGLAAANVLARRMVSA